MEVCALTIHYYDDGTSIFGLHTTRAGAKQELAEWVYERWDEDTMENRTTGNPDTDIDYFFEFWCDSYGYEIEERMVHGPEVAEEVPLGPDEVVLTPEEVAVVIGSLQNAPCKSVGRATGMSSVDAGGLMNSAYVKLKD